jgi:hypothetical protein
MLGGFSPFKNPNGKSAGDPAFVAIRGHVAAYGPLANKRILRDEDRRA